MVMAALNHILYVDDEPDLRAMVQVSLGLIGGFTVTLCASGAEALDQAASLRPDLILIDVMMPGLSGPETLARLRADPATAGIPAVFMTSASGADEVGGLVGPGVLGVIAKPFDPMTLADRVRAVWEGRTPA